MAKLQHRYKHHLHHRSLVVLKPYAPLAHLFFARQLPEPLSRVLQSMGKQAKKPPPGDVPAWTEGVVSKRPVMKAPPADGVAHRYVGKYMFKREDHGVPFSFWNIGIQETWGQ